LETLVLMVQGLQSTSSPAAAHVSPHRQAPLAPEVAQAVAVRMAVPEKKNALAIMTQAARAKVESLQLTHSSQILSMSLKKLTEYKAKFRLDLQNTSCFGPALATAKHKQPRQKARQVYLVALEEATPEEMALLSSWHQPNTPMYLTWLHDVQKIAEHLERADLKMEKEKVDDPIKGLSNAVGTIYSQFQRLGKFSKV
jgi:hypothetical protein